VGLPTTWSVWHHAHCNQQRGPVPQRSPIRWAVARSVFYYPSSRYRLRPTMPSVGGEDGARSSAMSTVVINDCLSRSVGSDAQLAQYLRRRSCSRTTRCPASLSVLNLLGRSTARRALRYDSTRGHYQRSHGAVSDPSRELARTRCGDLLRDTQHALPAAELTLQQLPNAPQGVS
jgi:hypothetical protein